MHISVRHPTVVCDPLKYKVILIGRITSSIKAVEGEQIDARYTHSQNWMTSRQACSIHLIKRIRKGRNYYCSGLLRLLGRTPTLKVTPLAAEADKELEIQRKSQKYSVNLLPVDLTKNLQLCIFEGADAKADCGMMVLFISGSAVCFQSDDAHANNDISIRSWNIDADIKDIHEATIKVLNQHASKSLLSHNGLALKVIRNLAL